MQAFAGRQEVISMAAAQAYPVRVDAPLDTPPFRAGWGLIGLLTLSPAVGPAINAG
jgi:hypothetical protein